MNFQQIQSTDSQNLRITSSLSEKGALLKFKPWVFKPKKTIYSLEVAPSSKPCFSTSHWNEEQNKNYISFLIKFREVIEGQKKTRRKWHLNRIMSKHVVTRSHEQCRSHHQKMLRGYQTIQGIIQHFQSQIKSISGFTQSTPVSSDDKNQQKPGNFIEEQHIFEVLNWQKTTIDQKHQMGIENQFDLF